MGCSQPIEMLRFGTWILVGYKMTTILLQLYCLCTSAVATWAKTFCGWILSLNPNLRLYFQNHTRCTAVASTIKTGPLLQCAQQVQYLVSTIYVYQISCLCSVGCVQPSHVRYAVCPGTRRSNSHSRLYSCVHPTNCECKGIAKFPFPPPFSADQSTTPTQRPAYCYQW